MDKDCILMKCSACETCCRDPQRPKRCIYGGPFIYVPYKESK